MSRTRAGGRSDIGTVCVVGAGGREHALAVVLGRTADVVVTPGNPGMAGRTESGHTVTCTVTPPEEVEADLYVIGPEAPLVDGLADRLRAGGRLVLGPGADGARLEGSKAFMKKVLAEAGVPTARFEVFGDAGAAKAYLRTLPGPWVIKTDGLAAGKGVLVTDSLADAEADIEVKLSGHAFGDAGRQVVIEEGLVGPECSLLVLCDGDRLVPLAPAQDFKRLADRDRGPNTGGMGAYSPLSFVDTAAVDELVDRSVAPLVAALSDRGIDYRGVLYAGLMLTAEGPKVLEFNVRFGDPEAQVVLARLEGDLTALLAEAADGSLTSVPRFLPDAAVCVVMAAEGYPEAPRTGDLVCGLAEAASVDGVTVFHAGTAAGPGGGVVTAGGRVLGVTGVGATLEEARARAYRGASSITWPGMQVRTDIALAAVGGYPPTAEPGPRHPTPTPGHRVLS